MSENCYCLCIIFWLIIIWREWGSCKIYSRIFFKFWLQKNKTRYKNSYKCLTYPTLNRHVLLVVTRQQRDHLFDQHQQYIQRRCHCPSIVGLPHARRHKTFVLSFSGQIWLCRYPGSCRFNYIKWRTYTNVFIYWSKLHWRELLNVF